MKITFAHLIAATFLFSLVACQTDRPKENKKQKDKISAISPEGDLLISPDTLAYLEPEIQEYSYDYESDYAYTIEKDYDYAEPKPEPKAYCHTKRNAYSSLNAMVHSLDAKMELAELGGIKSIFDDGFTTVIEQPLSTFSIDVDNASYTNTRQQLNAGQLPQKEAVRIEEFVNYFDYNYPEPKGEQPIEIITEVGPCPWNAKNQLVHVGLQGKKIDEDNLPASNFVFLLDVSGSMGGEGRLPLLVDAFKLLLPQLTAADNVAIVTYASGVKVALPATSGDQKETIIDALDNLTAGGSTNGQGGIQMAYQIAEENLLPDGNNRIILATDGDFNVGVSGAAPLADYAKEQSKKGIYLTICGFGMGNYKDGKMEEISNKADGNCFYIDGMAEAKRVFEKGMRSNMFTIAKDVKIQVAFNPKRVASYRLIGYENRRLANQDFVDDSKDTGEMGPGHSVTAIYEIVPMRAKSRKKVNKAARILKKRGVEINKRDWDSPHKELLNIALRYKPTKSDSSLLVEQKINRKKDQKNKLDKTSETFRFSAAVASWGILLSEDDKNKRKFGHDAIITLAKGALGEDLEGQRAEFIELVQKSKNLSTEDDSVAKTD